MSFRPALIIFDCDGVLVDSEMLSARILTSMMKEAGFEISSEIFRSDFLGRSFASAAERAHARFGRPLPSDFESDYRKRLFLEMEHELRPMPDVVAVLESLKCPYCLATSSSPQRLAVSLRSTGLAPFFADRCFTASEVKRGKPAPDLFLHAAAKLGIPPDACVVIEDSELGVRAALSAGMRAWHFAGGSHVKAGYHLPPELTPHLHIPDMNSLKVELARLDCY
jgi:HAD superfamily hydrolase (TIGR01509 family)